MPTRFKKRTKTRRDVIKILFKVEKMKERRKTGTNNLRRVVFINLMCP